MPKIARTSKRKARLSGYEGENRITDEKQFLVGIYARLSVDSTDKKNESIDSQIAIAKKHISQLPNMTIADIYSDLGATGINFERSAFQRLMWDIRQKKVNCVVVKDFSRFGRNYIETGNYLEKIFPFMGVRFISVTDHYDSLSVTDSNENLDINLKHIINELYAKDIAIRVESTKLAKLKQGSYVGGRPPYGYTKQKIGDKSVLFPEEGTKDIVLCIYDFYDAGMGLMEIIKRLYQMKVHRPAEYRKTGHIYYQDGDVLKQWSETTLAAMLTNPVYIGTLIQKQGKIDNPVIVENAHQALVPKDLFYRVTERSENYKKDKKICHRKGEEPDIFHEILYCGECSHKLKRMGTAKRQACNQMRNRYVYGCPGIGRMDDQKCGSHYVPMKEIEEVILAALKKEFSMSLGKRKDYTAYSKAETRRKKERLLDRKEELKRKADSIGIKTGNAYIEYRRKKITQEAFLNFKQEQEKQRMIVEKELEEIQMEYMLVEQEEKQMNERICRLVKCEDNTVFDADIVRLLIARINVYADKRIEIQFNFRKDEYRMKGSAVI